METKIVKKIQSLSFLKLLPLAFLLIQCGPHQQDQSAISVYIPPAPSNFSFKSQPSQIGDFSCFAVNVMGDGIPTSTLYTDYNSIASSVSTLGKIALSKTSDLIVPSDGGQLEVTVPTGKTCIVSLVGFMSTNGCGGSPGADDLNNTTRFPLAIEISRQSVTVTGDTTLTFNASISGYGSKTESRLGLTAGTPTPAPTASPTPVPPTPTPTPVTPTPTPGGGAAVLADSQFFHDFGSVQSGFTSTQTITFQNTGGVAATGVTLQVQGMFAGEFTPSNNTCSGTVAAGASCSVDLTWAPTGGEGLSPDDYVTATYNDGTTTQTADSGQFRGDGN